MEEKLESIVRDKVVRVYGRRVVSSRDCIQLADEIYQKTNLRLNPNTLRRFFGLIKSDYPPSQTTLNILARYCGFHSADEMFDANNVGLTEDKPSVHKEEFIHYLVSLFRDIKVKDSNDETFYGLIKHTINFLNNNPSLSDEFQSQIAKTENGQHIYFEKFVNLDKLGSYYGDGLRYYAVENKTPNAQIFANSLFVLRDWLTENNTKIEQDYDKVNFYKEVDGLNPIVYGRYFAAPLYYAHANNLPTEKPLAEINNFYNALLTSKSYSLIFPYFNQIISMALMLTGHYKEAMYYIKDLPEKMMKYDENGCISYFQGRQLLQAFAHYKMDEVDSADRIFKEVKPQHFCFLNKSFSNIFYVYLSKELKRRNGKEGDQLTTLINETGFSRLRSVLDIPVLNKTEHQTSVFV